MKPCYFVTNGYIFHFPLITICYFHRNPYYLPAQLFCMETRSTLCVRAEIIVYSLIVSTMYVASHPKNKHIRGIVVKTSSKVSKPVPFNLLEINHRTTIVCSALNSSQTNVFKYEQLALSLRLRVRVIRAGT